MVVWCAVRIEARSVIFVESVVSLKILTTDAERSGVDEHG
jgi:hypothetical protein